MSSLALLPLPAGFDALQRLVLEAVSSPSTRDAYAVPPGRFTTRQSPSRIISLTPGGYGTRSVTGGR